MNGDGGVVLGAATSVERLRHGRIRLALHRLREGSGRPLLLLHGLGERSPWAVPSWAAGWPGPVAALDFTGHGDSDVPAGGGYTCEVLMADADIALEALGGEATVAGRGLGGYVALMIAGARPTGVRGAVIADGPGLAGGGPIPATPWIPPPDLPRPVGGTPDPLALIELSRDIRPPDYAVTFVHQAVSLSGLEEPICVAARVRPPWLAAVADLPGVAEARLPEALDRYR